MREPNSAELRVALYARVSTEEQREGQNIDSQLAELQRYCREQSWTVAGVYKDEGWSGSLMARPDLDRLRDDARKRVFDAVLINDVDRLARDVAHLGVIKRDLEKQGAKVLFRKLPADASPTANLMVNILGSFAEFERELILDRTRRGRRHKVEVKKQYLGSNTAFGYRYRPKDRLAGKEGSLEVQPAEAATVRRMFAWVDAEGLSARQVVGRLNRLGVLPRKGGRGWARSSVLRILRNEMYAGVWYYNKFRGCEPQRPTSTARYRKSSKTSTQQRPRAEWLPLPLPADLVLVPRDRWLRVQAQLDRNTRFSPRNEKHQYLLKGLLQCGGCQARYVGEPSHGRFSYRCYARCKRYPSIGEDRLNHTVLQAIEGVLQNPQVVLEQVSKLAELEAEEQAAQVRTANQLETEVSRLHTEEDRLLDAFRTGVINRLQLSQQLTKLKGRREALEAGQAALKKAATPLSAKPLTKPLHDYGRAAVRRLRAAQPDEQRQILRLLIRNIVFEGTRVRIQGQFPPEALGPQPAAAVPPGPPADGRIAPTTVDLHGRNPAQGLRFELRAKVRGHRLPK